MRQLETWQEKVQQELEEKDCLEPLSKPLKERLASERRRERMNSIKHLGPQLFRLIHMRIS